jgi:nucleotide-binding universal stress UspA family protein
MPVSILCVIDFSKSSKKALQWAIANANTHKSHLTVLYPYRLTRAQYGESVIAMRKKIEDEALKNFALLEKDLLLNGKISYDFKSEVGFLADRVEEHTKNHPVSFMVIDKNIRTGNKESFDELVENTQIPLVIIP